MTLNKDLKPLKIKVDTAQFDMYAKAAEKMQEAIGIEIQDAIKSSAMAMTEIAKKTPFIPTGTHTVDDDGGPLFIPDEVPLGTADPTGNDFVDGMNALGYSAKFTPVEPEEGELLMAQLHHSDGSVTSGKYVPKTETSDSADDFERGPDPEAGPFALKPKPEPKYPRASLVEVDNG